MGQRPPHVRPPAYLSKSPSVPVPDVVPLEIEQAELPEGRLEPTRYGDWELKGIAVDF